MAENTPVSRKFLGNSTEQLQTLHGKARQIVVDTDKQTLVVMDGATQGGHPLAKEAVLIKSGTPGIKINGGTEANLASDITITGETASSTKLYEGTIDFSDEEQVAEIASDMSEGELVAYDCCDDCAIGDDPVYINGQFNTKEYITESGEWTAPVTGVYRITLIAGGSGAYTDTRGATIKAGNGPAGGRKTLFVNLEKGQKVSVAIGAGGLSEKNSELTSVRYGGSTSFGEYSVAPFENSSSDIRFTLVKREGDFYGVGGEGMGGGNPYVEDNTYVNATGYGAGGAFVIVYQTTKLEYAGNGYQGCVIAEWYDASKDKNISIDMAASVTIKELQTQLAALTARVQELENE